MDGLGIRAAVVTTSDSGPMGGHHRRLPLAAAVIRAAQTTPHDVVIVVGPEVDSDRGGMERAIEDLAQWPRIGAVVPRVLRPDGFLAEAGGTVLDDGTLFSRGAGQRASRSEFSYSRPTDGTRYGCIAVRRRFAAELRIDPGIDEASAVIEQVGTQVRAAGMTVWFDPDWTVTAEMKELEQNHDQSGNGTPAIQSTNRLLRGSRGRPNERILIVTATLSSRPSPWTDGGTQDLLDALAIVPAAPELVVAAAEGSPGDPAAAAIRASGIEVAIGAMDWAQWFSERRYHFSHVITTDGGLMSGLAMRALDTQPQAAKVLWTSALAFRAVEAMLPVTPYP